VAPVVAVTGRPRARAIVLAVVAAAAVVLLARALGLHEVARPEHLARLREWVEGFGSLAPAVFVAGYVIAELLFVPALPLTLLAGLAFGPLWGTVWAWTGATLGAVAAFAVARYLARGTVERWIASSPRLARLDAAVAEHGWRILMVTRLVPVFPFNLQNFAYGLTRIGFAHYVLVTALCILPGTAAYALAAGALSAGGTDSTPLVTYLGAAVGLIVAVSLLPRWLRRRSRAAGAVLP